MYIQYWLECKRKRLVYIHLRVRLCIVRSTPLGNAKASDSGTGRSTALTLLLFTPRERAIGNIIIMKLKHLACWATFIGGIIFISSCSKSFDDNLSNVDLIPVKISEKGKWSFINSMGEIIYEDEFKNEPSVAYNGFFSVEEEDGYSVYKVGPKSPEIIKNLEN